MLDLLGEGAFAVVRSGQCRRTGKKVAIKVIPTTRQSAAAVRAEVSVLKQVSLHTCIAKFMDVYEHADEGKFYIVMEFVDGGDLLDKICADGPWSEASAARLLSELGGAIALLHAQGLCHADVKPENVLLTAEGEVRDCARLHQVRLVDFGLTCEIQRGASRSRGSYMYWPPELYKQGEAGLGMDIWGLGNIMYILLAGVHPFDPKGTGDGVAIQKSICSDEPVS
jgi:serine/threonine protein kinase